MVSRASIAHGNIVPQARHPLEVQSYDTAITGNLPAGPWVISNFSDMAAGAALNERKGLRIVPLELRLKYSLSSDSTAGGPAGGGTDYAVRMIVFQTLYPNPIYTEVLSSVGGWSVLSPYNLSHVGQSRADANLRVLYDNTIHIKPIIATGAYGEIILTPKDFLCDYMRFQDDTALDPVKGGLHLLIVNDQSVALSSPGLSLTGRLLFTDA